MKISGFTIIRNASLFDFQIIESIRSILDIVDEYIVVTGDNDDDTELLLDSIKSPKIKIIKTSWDVVKYKKLGKGMIFAYLTDLGLKECSGDWCFYLQSDEVLHHDGLPVVKAACEKYLNDERVDGFVLKYHHLYADYNHYIDALHFSYPREIRIVRNMKDMHSWRDAQSFRIMPNFDYEDYWQKEGTSKLKCVELDAYIYHYGWSRDPRCMVKKRAVQFKAHFPDEDQQVPNVDYHDYGNLNYMPLFKKDHPIVMRERIANMSWKEYLRSDGAKPDMNKKFKLKYRILSFIENNILGNRRIGGFRNYKIIDKFSK